MKYYFKIDANGLKSTAEVGERRPHMTIDALVKDALDRGIKPSVIKITVSDNDKL